MKKIVIFGGGSGLSQILKGLKLFPVEVTAVVCMSDNGHSTGVLRKEFKIPAVGDITKVMLSMSDSDKELIDLLNYRFNTNSTLDSHSIKNLLLTALLEMQGSLNKAIPVMCKMLNIKGTVLPITSDCVDLIGITNNNEQIVGEAEITKSKSKIIDVKYNKKIKINKKVIDCVIEADLIVFSSGSLYTSIIPHLLIDDLKNTLDSINTPLIYLCNLVTQPGETDNFKVSDHIKIINNYLGARKLTAVIANDQEIDKKLAKEYATKEQKDPVKIDPRKLKELNVEVISDCLFNIENEILRHDSLKTSYLIFSYLMRNKL